MQALEQFYKLAWLLVPIIAIGGLFIPELGLLVMLVMISLMVIGFFNGRYFCGNVCPHGSLFENMIRSVSFSRKIPKFFKSKYLKWIFFIFFMGRFVMRFGNALTAEGSLATNVGGFFVLQYLIMPTILGVTLALLINPRTWCSFCPMGTMAELMGKLRGLLNIATTKVTISKQSDCIECGKCETDCPMELSPYENFDQENQFVDDKCIKCGDCVDACPLDLLEIK